MPPGAGSERSMRTMSGDVSSARSTALRASSASPTISKSGSRPRMLAMPTRNRAWSSTIRIRVRLAERSDGPGRPAAGPARCSPCAHLLSSLPSRRPSGSRAGRRCRRPVAIGRRSGADQLGSLAHELQSEVAAAAGGHRPDSKPRPSSRTSRVQSSSSSRVLTATVVADACLRTFCRASWATRRTTVCSASSSASVGRVEVGRDGDAGQRRARARRCRRSPRRGRAGRARAAGAG